VIFALLILLAMPFSVSANYQTFSWEKLGFLAASDSGPDTNSYEVFYNKLSSAINNFASSLNLQKTDLKEAAKQEVEPSVKAERKIVVTAYSSTPDQTDSSPFLTANGSFVKEGVIACNFLKFGTKVRIPEVYGDKILVVQDRMAIYNSHKVDVWMETRAEALQFGVKRLTLEILN
jgi:3D (Asp-Asp-Asp) domain-containing protein